MRKSELMELIGKNVRHYWTERKMTQDELSNIIGKNPSAITRVESGQRMMSLRTLYAVADALNISCDALLRDGDYPIELENIIHMLSGQSESSLQRISKVLVTLIEQYGETDDKS